MDIWVEGDAVIAEKQNNYLEIRFDYYRIIAILYCYYLSIDVQSELR